MGMTWTLPFLLHVPAAQLRHWPCAHPSGSCQILLSAAKAGLDSGCKVPPGLLVIGRDHFSQPVFQGCLAVLVCLWMSSSDCGVMAALPLADPALPMAPAVLHPHWGQRQEAKMKRLGIASSPGSPGQAVQPHKILVFSLISPIAQ